MKLVTALERIHAAVGHDYRGHDYTETASLLMPPQGSPYREMFDTAELVKMNIARERLKMPVFRDTLIAAKAFMARDKNVHSVNCIAMRANGDIWLFRVGKRGGVKKLWNFGNPVP